MSAEMKYSPQQGTISLANLPAVILRRAGQVLMHRRSGRMLKQQHPPHACMYLATPNPQLRNAMTKAISERRDEAMLQNLLTNSAGSNSVQYLLKYKECYYNA